MSLNLLPLIQRYRKLQNSSYKDSITLRPKPGKDASKMKAILGGGA
jgi:hypothetical protein